MSYALELADPAREALARLDTWLAEETLDEIDQLAARPPVRKTRTGTTVHDFVRVKDRSRYYVFLTVYPDEVGQTLRVESIGHFVRQEST